MHLPQLHCGEKSAEDRAEEQLKLTQGTRACPFPCTLLMHGEFAGVHAQCLRARDGGAPGGTGAAELLSARGATLLGMLAEREAPQFFDSAAEGAAAGLARDVALCITRNAGQGRMQGRVATCAQDVQDDEMPCL